MYKVKAPAARHTYNNESRPAVEVIRKVVV